MTYAFKMKPYDKQKSRDAMATVIELCRTQSVDSIANPFYNEIQFNPLEKEFGVGTMQLSSLEWRALLEKNYFGKLGQTEKKSPEDIVKTFCALQSVQSLIKNKPVSQNCYPLQKRMVRAGANFWLKNSLRPFSITLHTK